MSIGGKLLFAAEVRGVHQGRASIQKGEVTMLDGVEEALIERASQENAEFRRLLEKHQQYEIQLASYNEVRFLTSTQEVERKRLQKRKLQGKDRMITILRHYQTS
ncbi:hypothetical protein NKDENANG_00814 [Candidatus Entotheonellaceae bacterium PAL068K]